MTTATATLPATTTPAGDIFERAVCLMLEMRALGTKRKVKTNRVAVKEETAEAKTDPAMLHVSKDVLVSEKLAEIKRCQGAIRDYLQSMSSGPAIFKGGVYLLANELLVRVDEELQARRAEREKLIDEFIAEYETVKAAAKQKLGPLYDATDYPPVEAIREAFGFKVAILSFGMPASLETISRNIFERERENAAAQWAEALDESRAILREEMAGLVNHLVDKLDGKKTFRDSLVGNLDDFLGLFNARNIANDSELAAVVERARSVLSGVRAGDLRSSLSTRQRVAGAFTEIKATLDTLMVNAGGRAYNFDEE